MNLNCSQFPFFFFIVLFFLPPLISSQSCRRSCGKLPIRYPFGTGPGCGDPRFQQYVTCHDQQLTLTTHTGCYPVTAIDYTNQLIFISDPSMSTCDCTRLSKGFGLDWAAPFSFHDDTVFTLLDCSTTSSPIFRSATTSSTTGADNNTTSSSTVPLCDKQGAPICSFLYSCTAISMMNLPISSCCVYTPVDLGPSFEMDLQKLHCSSYSGFYSFSGKESNPENWKYGIALEYKFNVYNEYPNSCAICERTNGACGYGTAAEAYSTFICSCPTGFNTSTECFFGTSFNNGFKLLLPWQKGNWLVWFLPWILGWVPL